MTCRTGVGIYSVEYAADMNTQLDSAPQPRTGAMLMVFHTLAKLLFQHSLVVTSVAPRSPPASFQSDRPAPSSFQRLWMVAVSLAVPVLPGSGVKSWTALYWKSPPMPGVA